MMESWRGLLLAVRKAKSTFHTANNKKLEGETGNEGEQEVESPMMVLASFVSASPYKNSIQPSYVQTM